MKLIQVQVPDHMVDTLIEFVEKLDAKVVNIKRDKKQTVKQIATSDKPNIKSIQQLTNELLALSDTNAETIHLSKSETNRKRLQDAIDEMNNSKIRL